MPAGKKTRKFVPWSFSVATTWRTLRISGRLSSRTISGYLRKVLMADSR